MSKPYTTVLQHAELPETGDIVHVDELRMRVRATCGVYSKATACMESVWNRSFALVGLRYVESRLS